MYIYIYIYVYIYIYIYIYIYYQENKERLQEKATERYQNLCKEQKENGNNMVINVTKIPQKMENKSLLSIEKNL